MDADNTSELDLRYKLLMHILNHLSHRDTNEMLTISEYQLSQLVHKKIDKKFIERIKEYVPDNEDKILGDIQNNLLNYIKSEIMPNICSEETDDETKKYCMMYLTIMIVCMLRVKILMLEMSRNFTFEACDEEKILNLFNCDEETEDHDTMTGYT